MLGTLVPDFISMPGPVPKQVQPSILVSDNTKTLVFLSWLVTKAMQPCSTVVHCATFFADQKKRELKLERTLLLGDNFIHTDLKELDHFPHEYINLSLVKRLLLTLVKHCLFCIKCTLLQRLCKAEIFGRTIESGHFML